MTWTPRNWTGNGYFYNQINIIFSCLTDGKKLALITNEQVVNVQMWQHRTIWMVNKTDSKIAMHLALFLE